MYRPGSQIRFKTSMLKASFWDYGDAYILVSDTITIKGRPNNTTEANKGINKINKKYKKIMHNLVNAKVK